MIFKTFYIDQALGIILAHTLRLPMRVIKKGDKLTAIDIEDIRQSGIKQVDGVRLATNDITEDDAALAVASALAGDNLVVDTPSAGRCNLYARHNGLSLIDVKRIEAINLCGGSVTVATLTPNSQIVDRQAIATIKVIPFAVNKQELTQCLTLVKGERPAIDVRPFRARRTALILTYNQHIRPSVLDATVKVILRRLALSNSELTIEIRCHHAGADISAAMQQVLASDCELILISGAGITVDINDLVPKAIVDNGGKVEHFGMPVEPGNMLLLASCGERKIINLPGCSRSTKLNGLDWVLARIMADVEVNARDIMLMGVGGLIKDIPHSQQKQFQTNEIKQAKPRVAVVILAAGSSKRMGKENKLLARVDGKPLVRLVTEAAQLSQASPVVVVTGHDRQNIEQQLSDFCQDNVKIRFTYNTAHSTGMASSIRCGLTVLPDDIDGVIILLADMPLISTIHINELIAEFDPSIERNILAHSREGKRGNPVLWPKQYFSQLLGLQGDIGGRQLLKDYAANIRYVPINDDAVFFDIDTPQDLRIINGTMASNLTSDLVPLAKSTDAL